jgi:hypothetical protein
MRPAAFLALPSGALESHAPTNLRPVAGIESRISGLIGIAPLACHGLGHASRARGRPSLDQSQGGARSPPA